MQRFEVHSHTHYSNIRLIDCINRPERLIDRAVELGLSGIAITDHECLSSHMEVNMYAQKLLEKHPNFKVALGNEIYLTGSREKGQKKYYHFILIAKNKNGHRALRELSSRACMTSYYDKGHERPTTTYSDIEEIVKKYPGSLIATTACIGGQLSSLTLELIEAERLGDEVGRAAAHNGIVNFVLWCKEMFKDDFYIECAPGCSKEQIAVNRRLKSIADAFKVFMVIGTDAHYLRKEDRFVHKAYLNSKDGEREVDAFYEYSYLQSDEEIQENLDKSFDNTFFNFVTELYANSMDIWSKIENYSLSHKQTIPKVEVKNYPIPPCNMGDYMENNYPILSAMTRSSDIIERYWVNECLRRLTELDKYNSVYLARLEEEADIKKTIGEKLETNMFAYPVTLQYYCKLFWDCGSVVGAGRGSSCSGLNHYLLGITQLDPIEWDLPFWRYMNKERTELGDIDLDLCPSKRPIILKKMKEERGRNFNPGIDNVTKSECGCTLIATFGTEGTKSAILTACRGYRSKDYPDGIDTDVAQYMSSLIPSERGFLWTLNDVVYGNPEKGRNASTTFINEINQYPGLLDIMMGIEGLINKRSSHASGVILFDEDPYEFGCFMKTPSGDVITQYELHMAEAAGMTKYDFLVTEFQDKLVEAIKLLQKDGLIESELSLKEVYDKYFAPNVLPLDDERCWKALRENSILNIFQFDSDVGSQAAKKIKPTTILEMADANGLMRLMTSEKGAETPMEKYVRYKNNIKLWYDEMKEYGLTEEEMNAVEPHFKKSYGVPPSQEQLMTMLMDENICGFTLAEANDARKIVGKKQMNKIPALREKVLTKAKSPCLGHYIWVCGVGPQMGYSFSIIHALAYSFIGFQALFIATKWNPIYWNTACLIVNSGSLEDNSTEEIVDIYAPEEEEIENGVVFIDLPDRSGKIKKTSSTDYAKMAKAIGDTTSKGIKVSLIDINNSSYGFLPDVENNQILFGMKGLNHIGDPVIEEIIAHRPYTGLADFMNRCKLNNPAMISLIKAGAFDELDKEWALKISDNVRAGIMAMYLYKTSDLKKKVNLQNFNGLMQKNLLSDEISFQKRVFVFNNYLKTYTKKGKYFVFNDNCLDFYQEFFDMDYLEVINGYTCIMQDTWDKMYQKSMDPARQWLKDHQEEVVNNLNEVIFNEAWNKYAKGNNSAWEMESMCFYHSKHELADIDVYKYGISDFEKLSEEPEVDYYFKRNGKDIPIFKTNKIVGTIIKKDAPHSTITLLTLDGVVNVKFTKEYFAMFNRQISELQENGKKKIVEKGWFVRGTKVLITGFRRGDMFVAKSYKNTPTHQLYKITVINNGKDMNLEHERYGQED